MEDGIPLGHGLNNGEAGDEVVPVEGCALRQKNISSLPQYASSNTKETPNNLQSC